MIKGISNQKKRCQYRGVLTFFPHNFYYPDTFTYCCCHFLLSHKQQTFVQPRNQERITRNIRHYKELQQTSQPAGSWLPSVQVMSPPCLQTPSVVSKAWWKFICCIQILLTCVWSFRTPCFLFWCPPEIIFVWKMYDSKLPSIHWVKSGCGKCGLWHCCTAAASVKSEEEECGLHNESKLH